jgi:hypothetical protein
MCDKEIDVAVVTRCADPSQYLRAPEEAEEKKGDTA